ncbi:MAG: 50S ribosomal protein L21 [Candidatus Aminicenantes bacterium]|nr:50S ribosomal protein L21 [Candidatus Aminicenantes bacterium]
MLAVIKTGGKQYVVKVGDTLHVERLAYAAGQKVLFDQVLLIDDGAVTEIGTPVLEKAVVKAEVVKIFRDEKILVFKKKRRKQYRRTRGHRQTLTEVKILAIYPDTAVVPADELKIEAPPAVAPKATPKPSPKPKPKAAKPEPKAEPIPAAKPAKAKAKAAKPAAKKPAIKKPKAKKAAK